MRLSAFRWAAVLLAAGAAPLGAQLISIRTVPISQAHQFDLFPSLSKAMGGVSIAIDDSLADPFANPAKGSRFAASTFFGSPGLYSVSSRAGAGRTLPVGAWLRSGQWFGGASLALQQVDPSRQQIFLNQPGIMAACVNCGQQVLDLPTPDRSHGNQFGYAMLGRVLPEAGLSIGGSLFWSGLNGIDGTDLLYPGSVRLKQSGYSLDFRLGGLKRWSGNRSLSALVLHNRFATTHDVVYLDPFWDPGKQQFATRSRAEANLDHTNTWGMQVEYVHPLRPPGWRLGWIATANLMSHPKIPNYEIQNIPRDPGNSEGFNFGVGISKSVDGSLFGLDLVYEPIWSYTWADAAAPVETGLGTTIPVGGKTIENRFRFSNAMVRMGLAHEIPLEGGVRSVGLQLGLGVHSINYSLAQRDNVQATSRRLNEGWIEWTPTWGLSLRLPSLELRYRGSVTNGTGRPGVFSGDLAIAEPAIPGRNILVAPSGPLTMSAVRIMTHQVSVSFPLR